MRRKDRLEQERPRYTYKDAKLSVKTKINFDFLMTFSLKNKGIRVLKNKKGPLLIFYFFIFVEEQGFWSCKKRKRVFLNFFKDFFIQEQGF